MKTKTKIPPPNRKGWRWLEEEAILKSDRWLGEDGHTEEPLPRVIGNIATLPTLAHLHDPPEAGYIRRIRKGGKKGRK